MISFREYCQLGYAYCGEDGGKGIVTDVITIGSFI